MKYRSLVSMLACMMISHSSIAELKELDDKKLEDQKAKAGITIDLESQLYIGEIYWDTHDSSKKQKLRRNYMPEPVAPITYDIGGGKK